MTTKIWRVYNNGDITEQTHVLWPHLGGTGYGGDVSKWSEHNKIDRFGCAQIVKEGSKEPVVLYEGYLTKDRLQEMINQGKFK